jgi:UDP-galactopyranose mutase
MKEYIVVGAGITGAVISRHLAEKGCKVTVIDKRSTIAGNLYEEKNENGILVQKYGPHIFHTNSERVYDYITKY